MRGHDADSSPPRRIWFPAKRYGWGWGLPVAWQGWVVFIAYLALIIAGLIGLELPGEAAWLALLVLVSTGVLAAICWIKGERPRWRWGDD